MEDEEKTPPWKSFMYALAGAGGIYSSLILEGKLGDDWFGPIMMGIWGVCFWAGGVGNLMVDRRKERREMAMKITAAAINFRREFRRTRGGGADRVRGGADPEGKVRIVQRGRFQIRRDP